MNFPKWPRAGKGGYSIEYIVAPLDNPDMQITPAGMTALGVYFVIVGFLMVIFHKQVKQWTDDLYAHSPPHIWRGPSGALLTAMIIVFGVMSILVGIALLSVPLV